MRRALAALAVGLALPALAACGDADADTAGPPELSVVEAYAAPSAAGSDTGAAYLEVADEGGGDALVGVRTDAAQRVELHRTRTRDGLAVMEEVDRLEVPGGGRLRLEPGGDHLMLVGLVAPLEPGDTVRLELSFATSAPLSVEAPVLSYDAIDARLGGET